MKHAETQPDAESDGYHNYVLVIGTSLNELSFIGPFETERAATDFAEMHEVGMSPAQEEGWRVKLLTHPQAPEFWGT
jgi:hypothetical protein